MGASGWSYFAPYQSDISAAFEPIRRRDTEGARRYWDLVRKLAANPGADDPDLMAQLIACDEDTEAVVCMMSVGTRREMMTIGPLSHQETMELFGTGKPTHTMVERSDALFDLIGRGEGVYVVVYEGDQPSEIFFAGYTLD